MPVPFVRARASRQLTAMHVTGGRAERGWNETVEDVKEGARELLDEVMKGGTSEQSEKAKSLLLELA